MKVNEIIKEGLDPSLRAIIASTIRELTRAGHIEVDTPVLLNTIIKKSGQAFTLENLIDANKEFNAVRSQIDSIDPRKVKFSKSVTTVKNEPQKDPSAEKEKNQAVVSGMATRAIS